MHRMNDKKRVFRSLFRLIIGATALGFASEQAIGQNVVVRAKHIYPVVGRPIENGVIVCIDGKIASIGDAASLKIPDGATVLDAEVVVPGLIDVRSSVGLSGILNVDHDSDHLESSAPLQPELRALDAYNAREELVEYIRGFGVTTVHTGHAPGELISGQTLIAKTRGGTVEEALLVDGRAVAATLAESSQKSGKQSPGTRGKQMAMLRGLLIEAAEYRGKLANATEKKSEAADESASNVARNLKLEPLVAVLEGKKALMITADRAQDIASALRLGEEFGIRIWLDSAAEAYQLLPQIQRAGVPVLLHPSMARASGERENITFRSAALLREAGIPFAIESGFEAYVPKVRVVLFEAGVAAAHGLSKEAALESITLAPAKILGISDRVGSIEVGKDADLALYDGDPLEYTTHCVGVVIDGKVFAGESSSK
jgi:imidazolonepropionase-like amidohydrolase